MSCSTPPGSAYSVKIKPNNINNVTYFCSGNPILPNVTNLGGGEYEIEFTAAQVTCPGPVQIKEGANDLHTCEVDPCPGE